MVTFWAYDYNYQGTTQYHVYNNNKTCCSNVSDGQRFTMSTYKQNEVVTDQENDRENGWIYDFTFWAFGDKLLDEFLGKTYVCYKMYN